MSRWSPVGLPKARRQTVDYIFDPDDGLIRQLFNQERSQDPYMHAMVVGSKSSGVTDEVSRIGNHLRAAELYWATEDMTALAMGAGRTLPGIDFTEPPNPLGLIVFDGGIGALNMPGFSYGPPVSPAHELTQRTVHQMPVLPVDAITWGPGPDGTLSLWMWMSTRHMVDAMLADGQEPAQWIPPLMPIAGDNFPRGVITPDDKTVPVSILRALCSAWVLMQQPTLVDRGVVRPDRSTVRALQRAGAGHEVTLIDLRRAYIPGQRAETGEGEGRAYKHRWVVAGHWRDQPHGPGRTLRRRQWIPAHLKGPDGAPLLATERVNVWRR